MTDRHVVPGGMMFVEENYEMDPKTEILLASGQHLKNGMIVLIAETQERREYSDGSVTDEGADKLRYNRWCMVSKVNFWNVCLEPDSTVEFYADYGDGEVVRRVEKSYFKWLVKINSTPEYKKVEKTVELVLGALLERPRSSDVLTDFRAWQISENIVKTFDNSEIVRMIFEQGE